MLQPSPPGRIVGRDSCPSEVGSSSLSEVDLVVILRLTIVDFAAVRQMTACLEKLQLRFDAIQEPVDKPSQRERHRFDWPIFKFSRPQYNKLSFIIYSTA